MVDIVFPIGRMVGGSLKELHARKNDDGSAKVGADNKPMMECNFGVAIPKTQAQWNMEPWGAKMFEIGKAAEPVLHRAAAFSWKVIDGDDARPNKNGKIPNQQEGYAGHWILWFKQGWLPKLCSADGSVELQAGAIMPGQYVQVLGDVSSNGAKPPQTPGLYLNPKAVALSADGPRIVSKDIDTTKVGFGTGALPAGAQPLKPAEAAFSTPAAPAAPSVPVTPNAAFMAPPAPPAVPAGPRMTAKAQGASYDAMIAAGWTPELLRQHGMVEV